MMCKVALLFCLGMSIGQVDYIEAKPQGFDPRDYQNNCHCQSILVWDEGTQQNIGNCLTRFNDEYWCYVNPKTCDDAVNSSKRPGLHYSFAACQPQIQPTQAGW